MGNLLYEFYQVTLPVGNHFPLYESRTATEKTGRRTDGMFPEWALCSILQLAEAASILLLRQRDLFCANHLRIGADLETF